MYSARTTADGAFMEHRGWNRWQPVTNRLGANVQNSTKTVAGIVTSCRKKHMVRRGRRFESVRWLSRKPRKRGAFSSSALCTCSSVIRYGTHNDAVLSSFLTTNERPPTWVK